MKRKKPLKQSYLFQGLLLLLFYNLQGCYVGSYMGFCKVNALGYSRNRYCRRRIFYTFYNASIEGANGEQGCS